MLQRGESVHVLAAVAGECLLARRLARDEPLALPVEPRLHDRLPDHFRALRSLGVLDRRLTVEPLRWCVKLAILVEDEADRC